ncbi:MAG: hypothetical protein QE487_11555 [Fluviicola sp.]|nr:hypothetical protein [Fluviicola sp.]
MEDTHRFQLRIARDSLMDQVLFPLCSNYPLPDLPITPQNKVVMYENKGKLTIDPTQTNVDYTLFDETGTKMAGSQKRVDQQVIIETKILSREDYTFSVTAVKTQTELQKQLLQTVTIKVTVDEDIPLTLIPETPEYNQPVTVFLQETQSNNYYQVFDTKGNALSENVYSKTGGDLSIPTLPFTEDTVLNVKVVNKKTDEGGTLVTKPTVKVFPNTAVQVTLNAVAAGTDYNAIAELLLNATQVSADYQLIFKDIDDDKADKPALLNTTIGKSGRGKNDATLLSLKTTKLTEDLTVGILATKRDSGLQRELTAVITIPVRPDPSRDLIVTDPISAAGDTGTIEVLPPQRGVYYQLRNNATNAEVGWRRYYHKNYGIGRARIGVEFAVDTAPDDTVFLATGPVSTETAFNVFAVKATTGLSVQLTKIITLKIG